MPVVCYFYANTGVNSEEKNKIYIQDDKVCIECNSTCVVIVHQNVTLLNSSADLLIIHSVHVIERPASDADESVLRKCIPEINLDEYQIGVIPLIQVNGSEMGLKPKNGKFFLYIISVQFSRKASLKTIFATIANRENCPTT